MKKTLLISFVLFAFVNCGWAQITASEYNALMDLYQSTNGANWTNKTGWSTANPAVVQSVQGWYGVQVDAQGHVTYLNLGANNLSGTLPNSIGDLSSLTQLYLSNNALSGAIPSTFGQLSNLHTLQLHVNNLSGPIPTTFGNLTQLSNLNLDNNSLTTLPNEIGNLSNLELLSIGGNQLSGTIPSSLSNLTNLTYLNLGGNQITGSIPETIGNMINLTQLYLSNNELSGAISSTIGQLSKLHTLQLHVNNLSGPIPTTFGNLTQLSNLNLDNNNLTTLPSTLGNLINLQLLSIGGNELTGSIPSSFGNLVNLSYVHLGGNHLTGPIPIGWGSSALLSQVYLHSNKFTLSDFLAVKQSFAGSVFQYHQQALIDSEKTLQAPIGSPYTLTTTIDRNTTPASVYRWYKKVNGVFTPLNEASATGHTVQLPAITQADNGTQYYYTITNTAAPGLTLTSHLQTLAATTCQTPLLDFQFEEVNGTHTFNPSVSNADNCTITYNWDFGDGTSSQDQVGNHDFAAVGSYTVVLTITYQCGACASSTLTKEYVVSITNNVLCQSIYCDGNGGVGIGTRKTQGFALSVNGKIRASDIIKVYPHNQWADFVFDKNYKLRPLNEVELFIKRNGHLPEIPSAAQVEKEGVDLGAMDSKLLQKIEELTLYMIALKKENDQMRKELNTLKEKIKN